MQVDRTEDGKKEILKRYKKDFNKSINVSDALNKSKDVILHYD